MNGSRGSRMAQFSIECHTTKAKVITLANHRGRRQQSGPIETSSKYMQFTQSAGKRVQTSHEWFWSYF